MPTSSSIASKTTTPNTKTSSSKRRLRLSNTNTDTLCTDHDSSFFQKWIYRFNLWTGLYMLNPYERLAFHVVGWFSLTVSLLYFYVFWSGFIQGIRTGGSTDMIIGGGAVAGGGIMNPLVVEVPVVMPKVDAVGIDDTNGVVGGTNTRDDDDDDGVASAKAIDNNDMDGGDTEETNGNDTADEIIDNEKNEDGQNVSNDDINDQKLEEEEKTEL
eukprot:CAMPEP_0113503626 /NCGR_PEP_ID=MMETSP0014_2-20120614/34264_1 /TAXON_ID=2857 /ORGANISM="Nitzschia sp." /LENGTH=213 /DNA_ID=CAMNT_0000398645 /DNA_START=52 /DNA_END=693 /DNA_ORIENTATION=+ /assembly_acc=CAM_ASM_000159